MSGVSICVFGSQARGSADALSDRDVLLIGRPGVELELIAKDWQHRAWNVSTFSKEAFDRFAEVRSLFVQHVKQESLILRDDKRYLSKTLENYIPNLSYAAERNDALAFALTLPEGKENYWHNMCIADIYYVIIRNFSILYFADFKEYIFDFDLLIQKISTEFSFNDVEKLSLLNLRVYKHAYRNRKSGFNCKSDLDNVRKCLNIINNKIESRYVSSIDIGLTTSEYYDLRTVELNIVSRESPVDLDLMEVSHPRFALWQRIIGAGGYPKPRINARELH